MKKMKKIMGNLLTIRGLKVTGVVDTSRGRFIKFADIGELVQVPGALSLVKSESLSRSLVTIDLARMKMRAVAI